MVSQRLSRLCAAPFFALSLFALSGCYTSIEWRESEMPEVAFEDAWTAFVEIAAVDGFPMDTANADRGLRVFASRWRERSLPFGNSNRRRVHAQFERLDDRNGWRVRYYVEQQKVDDISKTMDPIDEDWSANGQDGETERRFAAKLRSRFADDAGSPERSR